MKILIACEYSGTVRDAFISKGHDAISCDLLDTEAPGPHYKGNVLDIINEGFDLMIAHPPCTFLTVSANKWHLPKYKDRFPRREQDRQEAILFFMALANAKINKIAIENLVGIMSTHFRKPNQTIHPYYFGDSFAKRTCLWLKNLPPLQHYPHTDLFNQKTHVYEGDHFTTKAGKRMANWYALLPINEDRWKIRSTTFPGFAKAMANQWG